MGYYTDYKLLQFDDLDAKILNKESVFISDICGWLLANDFERDSCIFELFDSESQEANGK